jgi:DNA invertase Pin-like site-specific DNA recombinase
MPGGSAAQRQAAAKAVAAKQKAKAETAAADEQPEVPLKEQIRSMFKEGKTRREIADHFEVSYQRVFALTKDLAAEGGNAGRAKAVFPDTWMVPNEDGKGETEQPHPYAGQTRVDVIRQLFEDGHKVAEIAKMTGLKYQIVFQATKAQRAELAGDAEDEEESEDGESEVESAESEEESEGEDESEDDEDDDDEDDDD